MLTRIEHNVEELKAYIYVKFETQKDSLCEVMKEIYLSMLKKFETLFEEKIQKQNEKIEILESEKNML